MDTSKIKVITSQIIDKSDNISILVVVVLLKNDEIWYYNGETTEWFKIPGGPFLY